MSETENRRRAEDRLSDEIVGLESRFDRHLEIYRENGIESKRVADALIQVQNGIERMLENSDACGAKVMLMHAKFMDDIAVDKADAARMNKVIKWGATIAAFGVILVLVRQMLAV